MVHIKRVELSHFKSFGGTTDVPLLPGFTVISGPNGSGKSNILDALLFCLNLASSKGMRAERLPDLINHKQSSQKGASETSVTVTFDLSDLDNLEEFLGIEGEISEENKEWAVTRRLRVTAGGNYASNYYINGEACGASELHDQLNRLRIYPEGYNVVLQGDVTRIITMNAKERREIIDELAGVAEFDRKINQAKQTLEGVREKEEKCQVIQQELGKSLEKLAADRVKAEKYQKLKLKIIEQQQWEQVLIWRSLQQQEQMLQVQTVAGSAEIIQLTNSLNQFTTRISETTTELEQLNAKVKALGEEEQLSVASQLATQKAKRHQLQQRQQEFANSWEQNEQAIRQNEQELGDYKKIIAQVEHEKQELATVTLIQLQQQRDQAKIVLEASREQSVAIAAASEAWVQEQTAISRKIDQIQQQLNPQHTEQAQLRERYHQLQQKLHEQQHLLATTEQELSLKEQENDQLKEQVAPIQQQIYNLSQQLTQAEQERDVQQETQTRLLQEHRDKQRQLDKLEATKQAQQEAQGTYATKVILSSNLQGVAGLVAQLGQVKPKYRLALEIAAGARLGHIVVDNDGVAAAGIALLKEKKAGRATFLPLNKIQVPRRPDISNLEYARGFVDLAVNLIDCESRYRDIFSYVFGNTVVFTALDEARNYLGQYRIITLDGELLETSGAMTGGSQPSRSSLHFGTATPGESEEFEQVKQRINDLDEIISRNQIKINDNTQKIARLAQELTEIRQQGREQQLHLQQLQKELERLTKQTQQLEAQISQNQQELTTADQRLQLLADSVPQLEAELATEQRKLSELEDSQTHSEWQQIQKLVRSKEEDLQHKEDTLRQATVQLKDLESRHQLLTDKITTGEYNLQLFAKKQNDLSQQQSDITQQLRDIDAKITTTEQQLQQLSDKLGTTKKERDNTETQLKDLQNQRQHQAWQLEKLQQDQAERQATLQHLQTQIQEQEAELPENIPSLPFLDPNADTHDFTAHLENLQKELRNAQKRLEALEPVNMLALEEYDRTQERLQELSQKLSTLEAERTEILLRVENFTTLRLRAFKEAFNAVNANFQNTFATLSEGDGYLELEDPQDPFNGGLNLIAHPKGKPVQRLSSMSGGEKSLTALSFIFSLQRYRPSPFYAFDEVDMFLDGSNVERLSKMIKKQAEQAQFIVVSLRRPMIESAQRTIGVTQARGAHTQVLGIKL